MALRTYTVYLAGGSAFNLKAARFEVTPEGVRFYNEDDEPLSDTFISPDAIIAVLPPSASTGGGSTGFIRA